MALNWKGGLSGAAGGASTGAMFGPWGAGIGGAVGGLAGLFSGSPEEHRQVSRFTKEQQRGLKDFYRNPISNNPLYQQGSSYLQNLLSGNPQATQAFEAPHLRQFYEQTVPQLTELFGGGTGAGGQNSSAFQNALGQAGAGLQERLASLRGQMQMNALPKALGYAQQPYSNQLAGLGVNQFENTYLPQQQGFGGSLLELAPYAMQSGQGLWGSFGQGGGQSPMSPMGGGMQSSQSRFGLPNFSWGR